jgi:hypothetical protein
MSTIITNITFPRQTQKKFVGFVVLGLFFFPPLPTLYFLLPPTPAGIMIRFLIDENTVMGIFLWPEV